jgi:hypothetical protein
MIRSGAVDAPLPFTGGLCGSESDAVGITAVPEHRSPQLLPTLMGEDHPGVDVGVRVGGIRTGEGDVNFTPLRCALGLHLGSPRDEE